jgi:photosystem II stability/assembly factor-like uncharacterized protein
MKKLILTVLTISFALFNQNANAQSWIPQAANIGGAGLSISDISVVNDSTAWAIASSLSGGVCVMPVKKFTRTTNGGTTWRSGNIPGPIGYTTFNISAIDSLTAWVSTYDLANLNNGRVYKTTNGGASWAHQSTATFTSACKFVHFFNANDGVAVGESELFITSNGGTNWVANGSLPFPYPGFTYFLLNSYEVQGNKIWLCDNTPTVYYSNDKGLTWSVKTTSLSAMEYGNIKGIAFKDSLNGLAIGSEFQSGGGSSPGVNVDNGKFFKTSDGGASWTTVLYSATSFTYNSKFMAKYDVCHIKGTANSYILSSEYSPSDFFSALTTDGGTTWTFIDSAVAHTALAFLPSGIGWSGGRISTTADGIYKWYQAPPTNTNTTSMEKYQKQINEHVKIVYDASAIFLKNEVEHERINALYILSVDGKKIKVLECTNQRIQKLETEGLSKGVYMLEVGIGRSILHKKIIIN